MRKRYLVISTLDSRLGKYAGDCDLHNTVYFFSVFVLDIKKKGNIMETVRPCGCKGIRSCLICEAKYKISKPDLKEILQVVS